MTSILSVQIGALRSVRLPLMVLALAAGLATAAGAAENGLVERRLACQAEARRHIKARPGDLELYRRVFERRQIYIQDCMLQGPREPDRTG